MAYRSRCATCRRRPDVRDQFRRNLELGATVNAASLRTGSTIGAGEQPQHRCEYMRCQLPIRQLRDDHGAQNSENELHSRINTTRLRVLL